MDTYNSGEELITACIDRKAEYNLIFNYGALQSVSTRDIFIIILLVNVLTIAAYCVAAGRLKAKATVIYVEYS